VKNFSFILFILFAWNIQAQQSGFATVRSLEIKGNKRTKEKIIQRELDILVGDTIYNQEISQQFLENEKRLLSTGLFTNVTINVITWDVPNQEVDLILDLTENWFIYPAPIFELADRNFNVWWTEQGRSLSRVNYGLRATHINLTGNRDKLKLVAQFGYTRKYEAEYSFPYLNEAQTLGIAGNVFYSENKEIGYATQANKTLFYQDEDERILLSRFRMGAWLDYRPALFGFHRAKLEFHRNTINEIIATEINPDYFLNGDDRINFFVLEYNFTFDRRVFNLYPIGGYLFGANLQKEGLGIFGDYDNLNASIEIQKYTSLSKGLILAMRFKAKSNLTRQTQAFANNTGLGYGQDLISGYDLFVMDGTDYLLSQNILRIKIIDDLFNISRFMPASAFKLLSFKMYLSLNFDWGYVNEPTYRDTNTLNNKFVYGYGPGLDMILYNNYLFQIEYSFNQLGESALFLRNTISF